MGTAWLGRQPDHSFACLETLDAHAHQGGCSGQHIFGLLGALGGVVVLLGGTLGSLASGSLVGAVVGSGVSLIVGVCIAALSLVGALAGFGLLNGKPWARYTLIVISILNLFKFPLGTLFAGYSLWVLFNSETQREFEPSVM